MNKIIPFCKNTPGKAWTRLPSSYWQNSTTTLVLQGEILHLIKHKGVYIIKQRKQSSFDIFWHLIFEERMMTYIDG